MTRMEPKEWLLSNGDIVKEPALEMSGSGKKIRVAGTTSSVYASELEELLGQAVKTLAVGKNAHVWMEVTNLPKQLVDSLGYQPNKTKGKLHLVHAPTDQQANTILWWRFKDTGSPFEAYLTLNMTTVNRNTSAQSITMTLTLPGRGFYGESAELVVWNIHDDQFRDLVNAVSYINRDTLYKWQEFIRDNPVGWSPAGHLGTTSHQHARASVTALLKNVRDIESLESIEVPFMGDPYNPSYRTLELYETNCNAALVNDLTEYLDAAPSIEQAAALYQQMLETLRVAGINVTGKNENDFMAALLEGEKGSLHMDVVGLAEEEFRIDHNHKLSVHLPTGTFIVECTHQDADPNTVAEKWQEELTMASLTGEESTLLAYARAYAKDHSAKRTKRILKERKP